MRGRTVANRVSARRRERKGPLGRSRRKWEDNITVYFEDVGWEGMD
jgi:hypothetical protein